MNKLALCITKLALSLAVFAAAVALPCYVGSAQAQSGQTFRTWVSAATGSDSNTTTYCQPSAPCLSIGAALSQTRPGGDVSCLGASEPDAQPIVTVTATVTIDCQGSFGGVTTVQNFGTISFVINAPGAIVTLRGLSLDGNVGTNNTPGTLGVQIQQAATVNIENCLIERFSQRGIDDTRTSGSTQLFIRNSVIRNNTGTGIALAAAAKNSVVIENVQSVGNAYGVAAATGNNAVISRSVMSENSVAGVYTDPGAQIFVDNTVISHNAAAGIQANGTVVLGNSDITFNTAGITGATTSYGNNRIFGNGATTTPTMAAQQ